MAKARHLIVTVLLIGGVCSLAMNSGGQQAPPPQSTQTQTSGSQDTGSQKQQGSSKGANLEETKKVQSDQIMLVLRVGRDLLRIIFSWPVIVLAIVLFLAFSRTASARLFALFTPFRSIKVFGAELVFTREAKATADEVLESYTKQVKGEFDRRAEILRLWDKLQNVVELHLLKKVLEKEKHFRSTIYVPDVLFQDTLYQLLDYYPEGGGRGRRKSLRFGVIGLAWRSAQAQVEGEISTDPQELLKKWGMKRHEATAAGRGRQSFACVVLVDESQTPVGLFYLDSKEKNAFGVEKHESLIEAINKGARETGLIRDLADLGKELRQWSPVIRPYEE
jgi:hypothetical protein